MIKTIPLFQIGILILLMAFNAEAKQRLNADDIDVRIINDYGDTFREYPVSQKRHNYRAYLEAKKGSNYAIEVRNRSDYRIGLVIAVDGRNIISGKRSNLKQNERMYILEPYQRAVYQGWRTGKNRVNQFYFTDAGDSYSAAWGDYSAMGVIAVAAFREKYEPKPRYYDDRQENRHKSLSPRSQRRAPSASEEAGTGFGDEEWSPSRRVEFEPERKAFAKHFLKYEWRKTLCKRGIIECRRHSQQKRHNRFWDDENDSMGFAPYPPNRRW